MRQILIYWIIGCLMAGAGAGLYEKRCPNDDLDPAQLIVEVAVWPAGFTNWAANPVLRACKETHP